MRIICLSIFFLVVLLLTIIPKTVNGSGCNDLLPCIAYSQAHAVFIGKLQKTVEDKEAPGNIVYAHFEIEKVFKGNVNKIEVVKFVIGNSERKFVIGEKYFVYKEDIDSYNRCNRTHIYSENDPDLVYVSSLSETTPVFTISGRIDGLIEGEVRDAKILIKNNKFRYEPKIDKDGTFSIKVVKKGVYYINIFLPFDAAVDVKYDNVIYKAEVIHSNNKTTIKYITKFIPNGCDHKDIEFYKDYKVDSSKISGKVSGRSRNPIPRIIIDLYPDTPNQNFVVAGTNEIGESVFDKIKLGKYILGINMRRPSFSGHKTLATPYIFDC